jgi:formylglycine-generating enzyme required for sulfatase activity
MKFPFQTIRTGVCALALAAGVAVHAESTYFTPSSTTVQVPRLSFSTKLNYTYDIEFKATSEATWHIAVPTWLGTGETYTYTGGEVLDYPDGTEVKWQVKETDPVIVTTPADMVLISLGTFTMGDASSRANIGPAHEVKVNAFFMDKTLVSYETWKKVYDYATNNGYVFAHTGLGKAANHPVHTVDWYDALKWCNARSQMESIGALPLTPCYFYNGQPFKTGTIVDQVNWANNGYRLPTEAEWEKAARGGTNGLRFPWGNKICHTNANYSGNTYAYSYDLGPTGKDPVWGTGSSPWTSPVTSFPTNKFGLRDMAGNLGTWCWDRYSTTYYQSFTNSVADNPKGPEAGTYRTTRGGAWANLAPSVACAARTPKDPKTTANTVGLRCVRTAPTQ